jgi:hypothetical protein
MSVRDRWGFPRLRTARPHRRLNLGLPKTESKAAAPMNHARRVLIIDPFDEGEMYALALRASDIAATVAESALEGRLLRAGSS